MLHKIEYTNINRIINLYNNNLHISIINEFEITIINDYNSNSTFYIDFYSDHFEVTDDFTELTSFLKKKLNYKNINDLINNNSNIYNYFLDDTKIIHHGYKLLKKNNSIKIEDLAIISHSLNPVDSLNLALNKVSNEDNLAISFSGGLDSTAIIFTIKNKFPDKNIVAFTWINHGSSNEDLKHAKSVCKILSIPLLIFEIKPEQLIQDLDKERHIIPPYPATYLAAIAFIEYYIKELNHFFSGTNFTIINGHGGDHLFFETIPLSVLNLKMLRKPHKIKDYSTLYSINYFKIFKHIIFNSFLKKNKEKSFNDLKNKLINEAKIETSTNFIKLPPNIKFFFPYCTPVMISCAKNYSLYDVFDGKFTRSHFRNAFYKTFKSDAFYRINKGHMTGAYQKSIKLNLTKFEELLNTSITLNIDKTKKEEVLNNLKFSSLGINGVPPLILKIIINEMILKEIKK